VLTELAASSLERFATFGDLLRFLRRRAGITQMELSLAVGYSDAQISRLEQNLRLPDIPTVQARLVPALGIDNEPKTIARLVDLAANVRREDAPGAGLCPYKGLAYFDETDSELFAGREELTARLVRRVKDLAAGGAPAAVRFLGIVGASGSGKSSLVRAGVVPAIRWDKDCAGWRIHVLTPTAHPLESLASSLTEEAESVTAATRLMDDLIREPRALQLFASRRLAGLPGSRLLIVVDQFEELFSLCRSRQEQNAFMDSVLAAAGTADGAVIVLITLRADFYSHCASHPGLRVALAASQEFIGAMTDAELRQAIEEPARRGRWELEPGLANLLLHDVGQEPGALPLLSHALLETWERRRGRMLTLSGYTSSGGVRGAIAETAESVFVDQCTREQQDLARRVFLHLTELGDDTTTGDGRRRVEFDELVADPAQAETMRALLQRLADARLITIGQETVEVAHEALIREWPRLRTWLDEDRQGLRMHRRISEAAREWSTNDRDRDLFLRGARLLEAEEWSRTHEAQLSELEREFLSESTQRREREAAEREAQRQQALEAAQQLAASEKRHSEQLGKRALYLGGALVLALLMTLVTLYVGAVARRTAVNAETERRVATARELSAAALNNLDVDPERSILLAQQAIATTRLVDGSVLPEALGALHNALVGSPIRHTLRGHEGAALSVAYRPDGSQLASIEGDGTVIVWDAQTGQELRRFESTATAGEIITPLRLSYSPDGATLLAGQGKQLVLVDPTSGAVLGRMDGHDADVTAVAFSRDGARFASADIEGKIIVWDTDAQGRVLGWDAHDAEVESVEFSPDGTWLVTGSDDATLKIWDAGTGELLQAFTDFTGVVGPAVFSPDGSLLAVRLVEGLHFWSYSPSQADGTWSLGQQEQLFMPGTGGVVFSPDGSRIASSVPLAIWDAGTGRQIESLVGHTDWVMGTAFDPEGKRLASTSLDGTVKIWDIGPGQEGVAVNAPPSGYGTRLTYAPVASEFATNGGDGTATMWDAETGRARLRLNGHEQDILSIAYSPDGSRFATGSLDASVIVWDTKSGDALLYLEGHEAGVRDVAFSPDGRFIATGGFDGTGRIWNAETGQLIHVITGHEGLVVGVAFSPDSTRLATSSTDATAKVWDVASAELVLTLLGNTSIVTDITYSRDGSMIATTSKEGAVILWDAQTGEELRRLMGHRGETQSVIFSPDGHLMATAGGDNTARVWDVATGTEVLRLPGSQAGSYGVAFSTQDGGAHLIVASNDGIVRDFVLSVEDALAIAAVRVTRTLTAEECREFLHAGQCPVGEAQVAVP
jgi:WD40 repeat protein/transcriptional regulator with XRE-family HTH domain